MKEVAELIKLVSKASLQFKIEFIQLRTMLLALDLLVNVVVIFVIRRIRQQHTEAWAQ